jgi:hypothetical protein
MASVAGQIRVDVIANTARFTGGMREASASMGTFTQEYENHVRKLSAKKVGEASGRERGGWESLANNQVGSMDLDRNRESFFALSPGQMHAQRLGTLAREMAMGPFGMSTRVTLSREAAATAAAIGDGAKKITGSLRHAYGEIGHVVGEIGGEAGFGSLARFFTTPAGMATAGIALLGAKVVGDTMERQRWIGEVRKMSLATGQGTEDTSKLLHTEFTTASLVRFQKSLYRPSPAQERAYGEMGINPSKMDPGNLLGAIGEVAVAFERIPDPTKNATWAMELFGKAGYEVIPALREFKEKLHNMPDWRKTSPQDAARQHAGERAIENANASASAANAVWFSRRREDVGLGLNLLMSLSSPGKAVGAIRESHGRRAFEDWEIEHAGEREAQRLNVQQIKRRQASYRAEKDFRPFGEFDFSPLADFDESMRALQDSTDLTPRERARKERDLRSHAMSGVLGEYGNVQPAPAMEKGSAEAYSAVVAAQMADPKIALVQETNQKLDAIVAILRGGNPVMRALGWN